MRPSLPVPAIGAGVELVLGDDALGRGREDRLGGWPGAAAGAGRRRLAAVGRGLGLRLGAGAALAAAAAAPSADPAQHRARGRRSRLRRRRSRPARRRPERPLSRKPANISFEQAAVVPVSGLIAQRGLVDVGHLKAGQRVLITGASGGVGSYAVQLAKAVGAKVTAVASASKADLVRSLGADHVIDYAREDFADGSHSYDLILDIAGNPTLRRLLRALTPQGTAVILGGEQGGRITGGFGRTLRAPLLSRFVSQCLTMVTANENGRDLERLTALIEAGQVTPHVDRSYPLEGVPEAMARLVAGDARGKVAISV